MGRGIRLGVRMVGVHLVRRRVVWGVTVVQLLWVRVQVWGWGGDGWRNGGGGLNGDGDGDGNGTGEAGGR